jgi:CheY-like chemotaxis protein
MPEMDGFSTAERLIAAGGRPPTIMMLTSGDQSGDAARCRSLGVASYLVKPVRQSALRDAIIRALSSAVPMKAHAKRALALVVHGRALNILLAEDNAVNQRVAIGMLKKAGHVVTVANNGKEAVAAVEAQAFDIVLMDMQMPEMSGAQAIAAIREREQRDGGHLPIIALTAHALKGDREWCLAAGADGYVAKPMSSEQLFRQMSELTGGRTAPAKTGDRTAPAKTGDVPNPARLLDRVGGDAVLLREIIGLFLEESPRMVSTLRKEVADGDAEGVCRTAHAFLGAASNFDADDVIESFRAIEAHALAGDVAGCQALMEPAAAIAEALSARLYQTMEVLPCAS